MGEFQSHHPPCTDMIICDRYLFKDGDKNKAIHNIEAMLKSLTLNTRGTINVVIFTMEGGLNYKEVRIIDNAIGKIKKSIENDTKVTFIIGLENESKYKSIPHDRVIIMNYGLLLSGDCFRYFNFEDECTSKGYFLVYSSLISINNEQFAKCVINDLNNKHIKTNYSNLIFYGDGTSNLLDGLKFKKGFS